MTDQPHPRWLRVVVGWEPCAIPLALAVDPIRLAPAFRWALTTTLQFGAALLTTDVSGALALVVFLASLLASPLASRASTDGIAERPDPVVEEQAVVEDVVREHE